jgi:hypothetical protein
MFCKTLKSHGVGDSAQLPDYPYRDDGLLVNDTLKRPKSSHIWANFKIS